MLKKISKITNELFEFLDKDVEYSELPNKIEVLFKIFHYPICFKRGNLIFYVLQDNTRVKDNKKIDIKEIFVGETTKKNLNKLIKSEIDIYTFLDNCFDKQRIGKINNKLFDPIEITSVSEIEDRIPIKGLKINGDRI